MEFKKLFLLVCLIGNGWSFYPLQAAQSSSMGKLCIDGAGISTMIYEAANLGNGWLTVYAASSGNDWNSVAVSDVNATQNNLLSQVSTNDIGDLVVCWSFISSSGISGVQAAIQPVGTGVWTISTLSDPSTDLTLTAVDLVLDNDRNVTVSWNTFSFTLNKPLMRVATGTVGGGWNSAVTIAN